MEFESSLSVAEIIPRRLYYTSYSVHPESDQKVKYLTADSDLTYTSFFADFGPLKLSHLVRFCRSLQIQLSKAEEEVIVFYSLHDGHKRANAGFLICCFSVLCLKKSPQEAWFPLSHMYPPFLPFRDASYGISTFNLTILDCACALFRAMQCGWFELDTFDVDLYEKYEKLENGDWNWIIPNKIAAMTGPSQSTKVDSDGNLMSLSAAELIPILRQNNISRVVRLNQREYDRSVFIKAGLEHLDLPFADGSSPDDATLRSFLDFSERETKGGIIVHCKAGLGRTGTLIACFLIKHYTFSARESIAWIRLCRPGSIVGEQQHYLERVENRFVRQKKRSCGQTVKVPLKRTILSSKKG